MSVRSQYYKNFLSERKIKVLLVDDLGKDLARIVNSQLDVLCEGLSIGDFEEKISCGELENIDVLGGRMFISYFLMQHMKNKKPQH